MFLGKFLNLLKKCETPMGAGKVCLGGGICRGAISSTKVIKKGEKVKN